jgi:hypothetical protein
VIVASKMSVIIWISALSLLFLVRATNGVETQVQQWDHAIDTFKRDVTEGISTLFEGLTKAMNTVDVAANTAPRSKDIVIHIIDKLSLKRLYRILAANNQLNDYTHEIVYWVPHEKTSEVALRDISILHEVLSAETVRVLDLKDFSEAEQNFFGSDRCSETRCYDMLAAKVHELRKAESIVSSEIQNHASDVWLLDIDMYWVGNLASILSALTLPSASRLPFSSTAVNDNDHADKEIMIKSSRIDFLGACVGDQIMKKSSFETSSESKSGIVHAYEKVLDDIEKLTTDATKALTGVTEAVSLLLLGSDSGVLNDHTQIGQPFCWPEIARFSTKFLGTLYQTSLTADDGNITVRPRGDNYFQLIINNEMKYSNILNIGLKDGLLGKDFLWNTSTAESDYNCRNCTEGVITESEYEMYKNQFLEQAAEPFVFEKKAGTFFRNIQGSSS